MPVIFLIHVKRPNIFGIRLYMKDIEEQLAKGSTIKLDITSAKGSDVMASYFLRAYQGRADLAKVVISSENHDAILENARNLIRESKIKQANDLLEDLPDTIEVSLERLRCLTFTKQYTELIDAYKSLDLKNCINSMVILQLVGEAYIELKDFDNAQETLSRAKALAQLYPFASASFSIFAFTAILNTNLKNESEVKKDLGVLRSFLSQYKNDELWLDRLLTYTRTLSRISNIQKSSEEAKYLQISMLLANWLDDVYYFNKSKDELALIQSYDQQVFHLNNWSYIPEFKLVLINHPKKIVKFESSPISIDIIEALLPGPLDKYQIFSAIWKHELKNETQDKHLRSILSKLRTKLPKSAISVQGGMISLN